MRETILTNCEKEFLLQAVAKRQRLDGRDCYDYRRIRITFGVERGCCHVDLGDTKVLAQVSCEVTTPKQTRPSEGMLFLNVELSPMASPQFEAGRQSDTSVELTRILERCIKESRCVDTESLCIMSGVKVWQIRCDVHVINHEGNLIDCASIAAISALAHFRRPDVTVSGEDVTIHAPEDRDPVPLSVHHMPICVTIAFYEQGKFLLVDPEIREEKVMDGKMVIGMNKHREICTFQLTGSMNLMREQVLRCSNIAVVKVTEITELIQKALGNDAQARAAGEKFGFAASIETKKITVKEAVPAEVDTSDIEEVAQEIVNNGQADEQAEGEENIESKIHGQGPGTATLGEGGPSTWDVPSSSDEDDEDEIVMVEERKAAQKPPETITLDGSESEEDEVVLLDSTDLQATTKSSKSKDPAPVSIDLTKALKPQKASKGQKVKNKKGK